MTYTVTHTDGQTFTILGEGASDSSTGITFIGQNFHNYGQIIANNFLRLLENQSSPTQPTSPVEGQLWWDSGNNILNFFDGNQFKPCSSSAVGVNAPLNPLNGDQWWDENVNQLKIYNGTEWLTIGPSFSKGFGATGVSLISLTDNNGTSHNVALVQVNGSTVGLASAEAAFTLSVPYAGISIVFPGISLASGTQLTGTASNASSLGNVSSNSYVRKDTDNTISGSITITGSSGLTVGSVGTVNISSGDSGQQNITTTQNVLSLQAASTSLTIDGGTNNILVASPPSTNFGVTNKEYVDGAITTAFSTSTGYTDSHISALVAGSPILTLNALSAAINNDTAFSTTINNALALKANINSPSFTGTPASITASHGTNTTQLATTAFVQDAISNNPVVNTSITTSTNGTIDLGSATNSFRNLYGTATRALLANAVGTLPGLTVNGSIMPVTSGINNIGSDTLKFNNIYANTVHANLADLAEKYVADAVYQPGTVVIFGGQYEITISGIEYDTRIAGVVSEKPAYLMNNDAPGLPIALTGKVTCRVLGKVQKGDILVNSYIQGVAMSLPSKDKWTPGCVIGKSLEEKLDDGVGKIFMVVGRF